MPTAGPVSVIGEGSNGGRVDSIVDATKVALDAPTTAGAMAFRLTRMLKSARR